METTTQSGATTLPPRITKTLIDRLTAMVTAGIAGEKREPFQMIEVYTGGVVGELPQSSPEDVAAAVAQARAAQREWASWSVDRRAGGVPALARAAADRDRDHRRPDPDRLRQGPADGHRGDLRRPRW